MATRDSQACTQVSHTEECNSPPPFPPPQRTLRGLKWHTHSVAPAHWVEVWGLWTTPVVEIVGPSVEMDQELSVRYVDHRGNADELRVGSVLGLQLHAHLEPFEVGGQSARMFRTFTFDLWSSTLVLDRNRNDKFMNASLNPAD